jgi:putative ABC transport system substrate-binding protein
MDRRTFLVGGVTLLPFPRLLRAQANVPTIGLLWNDSVKPSPFVAMLGDGLRDRGYAVGRTVRFEDAVALEGYGPMADNAAALVRAKVDLIVTFGATATLAAAKATKDIPIVAIIGADPVASGLAKSLSRPGGNLTGVWTLSFGLNKKRIELLKELAPRTSRLGILFAPGTAVQGAVDEAEAAARALKLEIVRAEVRTPDEIEPIVAGLVKSRVNGIFVTSSTLLAVHGKRVVASMASYGIPAVYGVDRYIDAGGLMVYAPSIRKAFGRVANYADRILKGGRPGDMPIEQTTDVELVINLKTARALGIAIPQAILQRADRAIE